MSVGDTSDPRLSRIATPWSALGRAHESGDTSRAAQAEVLERYRPAILRYLAKLIGQPDLTDELGQEFALRFVRGDFKHVRPERGRFHRYIKAALRNLVHDYYQRNKQKLESLPTESQLPLADPAPTPGEEDFQDIWKKELISRAWAALREFASQNDLLIYESLRLKVDDPRRRSEDIASLLSQSHGTEFTAAAVRQWQHRGRKKFAEFLRDAVAAALPPDDPAGIDEELADLGLLVYCS